MNISAIWLALIFLILSWVWAAVVERGVSSSLFAYWAIAVAVILSGGISIG